MTQIKYPDINGSLVAGNFVSATSANKIQDSGVPVSGGGITIPVDLSAADRTTQNVATVDVFQNITFGSAQSGTSVSVAANGVMTANSLVTETYQVLLSYSPNQSTTSGGCAAQIRYLIDSTEADDETFVIRLNTGNNWNVPADKTFFITLAPSQTLTFQMTTVSTLANNNDFRLITWSTASTPSTSPTTSYSARIKMWRMTA